MKHHKFIFLPAFLTVFIFIVGCQPKQATPPEVDLYPVKAGNRYGYINAAGKVIIKPQFFSVNWFQENRAIVETAPGKKAMIDLKGNIIFQDTTGFLHLEYRDGLIRFNNLQQDICFVDSLGKVRFCLDDSVLFSETFFANERLLIRQKIGYFAYLNLQGEAVYRFRRGFPGNYADGLARRNFNGRTCYFNTSGARQFCIKGRGSDFSCGLALITQDKNVLYVDKFGKKKLRNLPYTAVTPFINGFAEVQVHELKNGQLFKRIGFINTEGKETIPLTYIKALSFSSGVVAVQTIAYKWIFLDQNNRLLFSQTFDDVAAPGFVGKLAYVQRAGAWFYINKNGEIVWKAT